MLNSKPKQKLPKRRTRHNTPIHKHSTLTTSQSTLTTTSKSLQNSTQSHSTSPRLNRNNKKNPLKLSQKRHFWGITKPFLDELHEEHERGLSGPTTSETRRNIVRATKSIKDFVRFGDSGSITAMVTSPEFIELRDIILSAEEQTYRAQASDAVITVPMIKKWLTDQAVANPTIPYYRIIYNCIPNELPSIKGIEPAFASTPKQQLYDDDSDEYDDEFMSTRKHNQQKTFFQRLQRQQRLSKRNDDDAEWILRRSFWKQQSGFAQQSNIPFEWAEFVTGVMTNAPVTNENTLQSLSTYIKFCGFPLELLDTSPGEIVSQRANHPDLELASEIVENVIASSQVLYQQMIDGNHPKAQHSILSDTWFQNLVQMTNFILAFESRLNTYQQSRVGRKHIPFATILSKHFTSNGTFTPRERPVIKLDTPLFGELKRHSFDETFVQDFDVQQDPLLIKKRYNVFLGGRNLGAIASQLQIDDIYMLVGLVGEILHKFNGVQNNLPVQHSFEPYSTTFEYDSMKKVLDRIMTEAQIHTENVTKRNEQIEEEITHKLEQVGKEVTMETIDAKLPVVDTSKWQQSLANDDGENNNNDTATTTTTTKPKIKTSIKQPKKPTADEVAEHVADIIHTVRNTVFIPDIAEYFVDPLDDSQSFIRGFNSEDVNDFLHDTILQGAVSQLDKNHIKNVINFKLLQSRNWLYLDLQEVPQDKYAHIEERFGPVDTNTPFLNNLHQVYETMLVQNDINFAHINPKIPTSSTTIPEQPLLADRELPNDNEFDPDSKPKLMPL